jgi:DNA polymerase-3 subunit alpha
MSTFVPLHLHSEFSSLDGACAISKLPDRLKELGFDACATTDHGNCQSWPLFEKEMTKAGIKPIFGIEIYLTDDRFNQKTQGAGKTETWHLTLLAETDQGLKNLMKISSYAFLEGLTQVFGNLRPRADWALLQTHADGIVCLSGCMASPVMGSIFAGDLTKSREYLERLESIFPGRTYGEIQNVGITEEIPAYSELAIKLGRCPGYTQFDPEQRRRWQTLAEHAELHPHDEAAQAAAAEARQMLTLTAPLSQTEANRELVEMCKEMGLKYVATGDTHYLREGDAFAHDAMICLGTKQIPQKRPDRKFSLLPKRYHLRSEDEMRAALAEWPEAIEVSREIADRCNASIEWDKDLLPQYPLPEEFVTLSQEQRADIVTFLTGAAEKHALENFEIKEQDLESAAYLKHLSVNGLIERMCKRNGMEISSYEEVPQEYRDRLEFELAVVHRMGFDAYFLVVWDILDFAHSNNLPAGPGRGSAAGSLASYALQITQLDPLTYGLLFERFLNPDRISMPDVDIDLGVVAREKMIAYVKEKYGKHAGSLTAVAQIITFSTYAAKGSVKNAARVLAEPDEEGKANAQALANKLSKIIPDKPGVTLKEIWEGDKPDPKTGEAPWPNESREFKTLFQTDPAAAAAVKLGGYLEGMVAAYGQHAAAVVIADHPIEEDVPLQIQLGKGARKGERILTTQWPMAAVDRAGLLKLDLLGLRNLDLIAETLEKVRHTRGVDLGTLKELYNTLPLDDVSTYENIYQRGETIGTFQFESSGMRGALAEVRPTQFTDLIALVALYRPGPMQNIPTYARRKAGKEPVRYPDPRIEEILAETYGITVYQETSMLISRILAGFTPGKADELRKAIGKKLKDKMAELKQPFIEGCMANDVSEKVALELWDDNERSAEYSFNKSHAACYALIAYYTGYLKNHYPPEYMASLLSTVMGKNDKIRPLLAETKRMGIRVTTPDLNRSLRSFSVHEREGKPGEFEILFGLTALSGVGDGVVPQIRAERDRGGNFTSLFDLVRRSSEFLDTKTLQSLIEAGALDSTGATRKAMYEVAEETLKDWKKKLTTEQKAFVNGVKGRLELALGESEDQMSLLDTSRKKAVLTKDTKLVIDAAAGGVWKAKMMLPQEELEELACGALRKAALSQARKDAKDIVTHQVSAAVQSSIADEEEGDKDLKTRIAEMAERLVDNSVAERDARAKEIIAPAVTHIADELAVVLEQEDLKAAMEDTVDPELPAEEWEYLDKLNREREVLGIYVSGHPLDRDSRKWARYVTQGIGHITSDLIAKHRDDTQRIVGVITAILKEGKTRKGDTWFRIQLEDLTGSRDVMMFKDSFEGLEELIYEGSIIGMQVKVEEDTFTKQRQAEEAVENGEEDVEDTGEMPIKLMARRIWTWQPGQIKESELKSIDDVDTAQLPIVDEKLIAELELQAAVQTTPAAPAVAPVDTAPAAPVAESSAATAAPPVSPATHAPVTPAVAPAASPPAATTAAAAVTPAAQPTVSEDGFEEPPLLDYDPTAFENEDDDPYAPPVPVEPDVVEPDVAEPTVEDEGDLPPDLVEGLAEQARVAAAARASSPANRDEKQPAEQVAETTETAEPAEKHAPVTAPAPEAETNNGATGAPAAPPAATQAPSTAPAGNLPPMIQIRIEEEKLTPELQASLKDVLSQHPGPVPVKILVGDKRFGGISVMPTPELQAKVKQILHGTPAPAAEPVAV